MKKINIISSYPSRGCGISTFTQSLIQNLKRNNVKANFITVTFWGSSFLLYLKQMINCLKTSFMKGPILIEYTPSTSGPLILFPIILCKLLKKKIVIESHEIIDTYDHLLIFPLIRFQETVLFKLVDKIIVHTNIHKDFITKNQLYKKSKIKLIEHGTERIIPRKLKETDRKNLLMFGQIRKDKNHLLVLEAFKLLPSKIVQENKLIIAGKITDKAYFKKLNYYISKQNLKNFVILRGFLNPKEIDYLYRNSFLLLLPYDKVTQSGPLSLSLGYNLPSILSNKLFFKKFNRKYNTSLILSKLSAFEIKNKIVELVNNPEKYKSLQRSCENAYYKLKWKNVIRKYLPLLF